MRFTPLFAAAIAAIAFADEIGDNDEPDCNLYEYFDYTYGKVEGNHDYLCEG